MPGGGVAPKTKKNPIKVAEQFQYVTKSEDTYHLHVDGQQITDKPLTLKEIHEKHGPVPKLESSGVRVVKV